MKRLTIKIILSLLISIIFINAYCQKITAVSESKYVSIKKDPPKPPYLEIVNNSISLDDANENHKIDANENAIISFKLTNSGTGQGKGLRLNTIEQNGLIGLVFNTDIAIPDVDVGKTITVQLPVKGLMNIPDGKANFFLEIKEPRGFGTDMFQIEVLTQAFIKPELKIVDYKVSSQTLTKLEKRIPFDLEVILQNTGKGEALDIKAQLVLPPNIYCLSANEIYTNSSMLPGDNKILKYNLVANNDYGEELIPISVRLSEKYGRYAQDRIISLTMNQPLGLATIKIAGKTEEPRKTETATFDSPVDREIPVRKLNPNRIALIIGNEVYNNTLNAEVNVDFARHDAEIFKIYASSTLGIEEQNIFFLIDATSGQMNREIDRVSELAKRIGSEAELFFYYAGHGFPDESSKTPLLIPVDVDATNLVSAIRLNDVYRKFSSIGCSRVTVFLDACFSGGGRDQGLIAARTVKVIPANEAISGKMVVFSASSGTQSAHSFKEGQHGLFTFFLLKKLQDSKGEVTYGELDYYLKQMVGQGSIRTIGKPQDPKVQPSPEVTSYWSKWKF